MKDTVVISNGGKVSRLIVILALILIVIVVDITPRSGTSVSENLTLRNNPAILSIVEPSAASNDVIDFFANVMGNLFSNSSQDDSPADPAASAADFFAPLPTALFALSQEQESSNYHVDLTYAY